MNIRIFFFLIFFHISLDAFSQDFSIKGTVFSEEQTPIEFANVVLSDKEGKIIKGGITDSLGRFNLILDGHIQARGNFLTVSYLGYESHRQLVEKEDIGTISLYPNSKEIQEVIVTGRKSPYIMKGSALTANIQNSILKDAGNA